MRYISEPKITTPSKRLNAKTYKAFVDCLTVLPMTTTGSTNLPKRKTLKILVSRTKRSTTKPPPPSFVSPVTNHISQNTTPGKIAAKSMRFCGWRTNFNNLTTGELSSIKSYPVANSNNFSLSKTSSRKAQHVQRRTRYSKTKTTKHTFSMTEKIGLTFGAEPSSGLSWHSGTVDKMKPSEDATIVPSMTTDMIRAKYDDWGSSNVKNILSACDSLTMTLRSFHTKQNSPQPTMLFPFWS
mmetsp:Transcript_5243/g.8138  ORF Transcript_5243/g.8138 Transcript_5243/m.8138 type:complete len:240 (-) Transcript_5243:501-1220(-)